MSDEFWGYPDPPLCMECSLSEAVLCSSCGRVLSQAQISAIKSLLKIISTLPESRMAYFAVLAGESEKKLGISTSLQHELFQLGHAHSELTIAFKEWL